MGITTFKSRYVATVSNYSVKKVVTNHFLIITINNNKQAY